MGLLKTFVKVAALGTIATTACDMEPAKSSSTPTPQSNTGLVFPTPEASPIPDILQSLIPPEVDIQIDLSPKMHERFLELIQRYTSTFGCAQEYIYIHPNSGPPPTDILPVDGTYSVILMPGSWTIGGDQLTEEELQFLLLVGMGTACTSSADYPLDHLAGYGYYGIEAGGINYRLEGIKGFSIIFSSVDKVTGQKLESPFRLIEIAAAIALAAHLEPELINNFLSSREELKSLRAATALMVAIIEEIGISYEELANMLQTNGLLELAKRSKGSLNHSIQDLYYLMELFNQLYANPNELNRYIEIFMQNLNRQQGPRYAMPPYLA